MFFHRIHSNQVLQQMLLFGPEYERAEHKSLFLSHQTHVDKFTMAPDNRGAHGSCYSPVGELFLEQIHLGQRLLHYATSVLSCEKTQFFAKVSVHRCNKQH